MKQLLLVILLTTLASVKGRSQFVEIPIPGLPGGGSGTVTWVDFDNDGRLDFVLTGYGGSGPLFQLWRNTADGFTNVTQTVAPNVPPVFEGSIAFADYDNDGRMDFFLTGLTNTTSINGIAQLWKNSGNSFERVDLPEVPGVSESSVVWIDYNNDGRSDLLLMGSTNANASGVISQLWRNTGGGFEFVPVPGLRGLYFGAIATADYDNDGRSDFLISGFGHTGEPPAAELWRNTGVTFTNVPVPGLRGVATGAQAWADFDSDGRLDFVISGLSTNGFLTELWRNSEAGFKRIPTFNVPPFGDGTLTWVDYDNDGRSDLIISGLSNGIAPDFEFWRNTADGFVRDGAAGIPGTFDNAFDWGDFDGDGRLDLIISGRSQTGVVSKLWRNSSVTPNLPPSAPAELTAVVSGRTVDLKWGSSTDDHSSPAGLSYNVRVGTRPGGSDVLAAPALPTGVLLAPKPGLARPGASLKDLLPGQAYYWTVQAVDGSFAGSAFAEEKMFIVPPRLEVAHLPSGTGVLIQFTNRSPLSFRVFASANIEAPLEQWSEVEGTIPAGDGLFRLTDTRSATNQARFYMLRN